MTVSGRFPPLQPNDQFRPESVIEVSYRERPLPDRKADIAYEEIIVRRGNRFDCPLSLRKRMCEEAPHLVDS